MRRFHIQKINEHVKKENDEIEKTKPGKSNPSDIARGPNITPSSTYNFKK